MAFEIISTEDYKQIERFGLLPTDRDPSAWLRMVARVFAAYKEVSLDKSIVAYISGFWILNTDLIDGTDVKFVIQKGTCFIDDQFIGFTEDILFKYPKTKLIPGNTYWLVLYYKWSYERDFNVAEFQVIAPDLFDENHMLKIAVFEYTSAGEINLLPQDLDDQYADNFKKLMEIAQEKIIDSIETMKYHYQVFKPGEPGYEKFDPDLKSGDFVYIDYINGYYRPAAACLKRFDKTVGIYLYNKSNNYKYIIYEGIVDFSDPRWLIDDDRQYLLNLEPGTSYYLADACTDSEVIHDYTQVTNFDKGKISTYFFPGTVRVGFALDITKFFIRIDYTSELNTWNFIEVFGDSERFDKIYKDYFKFYDLQAQVQYLATNNQKVQEIISNLNDLINNIDLQLQTENNVLASLENDLTTNKNNFDTAKQSYIDSLSQFDNIDELIIHSNFYNNVITYDFYKPEIDKIITNIKIEKLKISEAKSDLVDFINDLSYLEEDQYNSINQGINNILTIFDNFTILCDEFITIFEGGNIQAIMDSPSSYNIDGIKLVIDDFLSDINSDNYTTFVNKLKSYIIDTDNQSGYLFKLLDKFKNNFESLKLNIKTLNENHKLLLLYKYDNNIVLSLDSLTYDKYSLSLSATCATSTTDLTKTTMTISSQSVTINNTLPDNYDNIMTTVLNASFIATKSLQSIEKLIYYTDSKLRNLISYNPDNFNIDDTKTSADNIYNDIQNKFNTFIDNLKIYYETLNKVTKEKIYIDGLNNYKNTENDFLLYFNNKLNDLILRSTELYNELAQEQQLLSEELQDDLLNRAKSIFSLSNYQRIIYNYTYITQRLKIKYSEREKVEDDIEIIQNKIYEVQNQIPVNYGLLTELEQLKASYQAFYNEINNEIESLTAEYNKIRTEYLGLEPIANNDPNFDPGPYAIFDLDCLETLE